MWAKAIKGSMHGYDVINPNLINEEIGTMEQFEQLIEVVHGHGMGWIQDIVPNHMGYSTENPWIFDLLEHGSNSKYYRFFDIEKHHRFIKQGGLSPVPALHHEYFLYQSIFAHFPIKGEVDEAFLNRLERSMIKALREAKDHSSWSEVNEDYEKGMTDFIRNIMDQENEFLHVFKPFFESTVFPGIINSVTQLIIKLTVPGIPDIYQGNEGWNFSFVDPDNRREVDYAKLTTDLDKIIHNYYYDPEDTIGTFWQKAEDGRIKQLISYLILNLRVKYEKLFMDGFYIPLKIRGKNKGQFIAYARSLNNTHLVCILPTRGLRYTSKNFLDAQVILPEKFPKKYKDVLTGKNIQTSRKMNIKHFFKVSPFGLMIS